MSPEQLFPVLNMVSLVSWLLLAIVPRRPLVTRTIAGAAVPAFFAVACCGGYALFYSLFRPHLHRLEDR